MKTTHRPIISTFESSGFFPEAITFEIQTNNVFKLVKCVIEKNENFGN